MADGCAHSGAIVVSTATHMHGGPYAYASHYALSGIRKLGACTSLASPNASHYAARRTPPPSKINRKRQYIHVIIACVTVRWPCGCLIRTTCHVYGLWISAGAPRPAEGRGVFNVSRAGLGLAALAHPGFVRIRIAVVEYGRGKVGASTAPRRRPQKPSPARRRAASRRRERALRSARLAPARDGRRARSRSHLSIPTLRARCVARDRGITTEPQRGARPAPPSHELVSRPPRRRKPTRCLKA